jgi:hypothetical protein
MFFSLEGVLLLNGKAAFEKEEELNFDKQPVFDQSFDLPSSENLLRTPTSGPCRYAHLNPYSWILDESCRPQRFDELLFQIFSPTSIYLLQAANFVDWMVFSTTQLTVSHGNRCFAVLS